MKTTCPKCGAAEWSVEEMKTRRRDTWERSHGKWRCGSDPKTQSMECYRSLRVPKKIKRLCLTCDREFTSVDRKGRHRCDRCFENGRHYGKPLGSGMTMRTDRRSKGTQ